MKFGLQVSSFTFPGGTRELAPTLERVVRTADDVGFDSIWVMDHFIQIRGVGKPHEPMLEGWTTLGWIAANTRRARLGLLVGGVPYRHPAVWVKAATALDYYPEWILPGLGVLDLESMVSFRRPLREINDGFDDLRAGRGIRTVLSM